MTYSARFINTLGKLVETSFYDKDQRDGFAAQACMFGCTGIEVRDEGGEWRNWGEKS